jgi:uncharacterized protein
MIGREQELQIFGHLLESSRSEFLVITGRRRVGKTYLIREGFKGHTVFEFVGTKDADTSNQLSKFQEQLEVYFPKVKGLDDELLNWVSGFRQLKHCLLTMRKTSKKRVVFFDEVPWIAIEKSNFLQELEYWWNHWASTQNIIIVISGSAESWVVKKIVNHKGGLHGRITQKINLQPFTLAETKKFLAVKNIHLDDYQVMQLYMVIGGIPHYLEEIQRGESINQIINRMCFTKNGLLHNEFVNLYAALFKDYESHIAVVRTLSKTWQGLTRQLLIKNTKLTDGGGLTNILYDLEACGFIIKIIPLGKKVKDALYRLADEFSLFYFSFIEGSRLGAKDVWMQKSKLPQYRNWQGYSFENLCFRHAEAIKMSLGIAGIYTENSSFIAKGTKTQQGVQIDMLIDRDDNAINLCEMKFYNSDIEIDKTFADKMRIKRELFKKYSNTKKYVINTIVTTYGVSNNEYAFAQVDKVVTAKALFMLNHF